MAVAYDIASTSQGLGVSSVTWAHTCTGTNMLLWVAVGSGALAPHNTSSVTYHTVTFTGESYDITNGHGHVSGHYLKAPDTGGGFNIIATIAGSDDEVIVGAASYTGVDQTTPVGTPNSATGDSVTPSVTIASASGELVVDGFYCADWTSGDTHTVHASQTERVNHADSGDTHGVLGISEEAGAASVVMSWTISTNPWTTGGISLKPFAGTPTLVQTHYRWRNDDGALIAP